MGAKIDRFCDNLRDRLNNVEARLTTVKANIQALPEQAEKNLREMHDKASRKLQAQKERVEKTRADLKTRAQEKMKETKEAVSEWKAKRDARKLTARADHAEADAIDFAAFAIDEADEAILDAIVARIDADAAQPVPASR
jgi:chromosome segregation ATPase